MKSKQVHVIKWPILTKKPARNSKWIHVIRWQTLIKTLNGSMLSSDQPVRKSNLNSFIRRWLPLKSNKSQLEGNYPKNQINKEIVSLGWGGLWVN